VVSDEQPGRQALSGAEARRRGARILATDGLYRPETERSSCGVGFVADLRGRPSHTIVETALAALRGLAHRGAVGSDPLTGDGCGVLMQIPHRFLAEEARLPFPLPPAGGYALGQLFLPRSPSLAGRARMLVDRVLDGAGLDRLGWREVPLEVEHCGPVARETLPRVAQVFVAPGRSAPERFERTLYLVRRRIERAARALGRKRVPLYVCSLSVRTVVYKGLLLPERLARFYPDLREPAVESALAVFHQRFSTNTFPSWARAHPYRLAAHNGEFNTLRGNVNWMRARESAFADAELADREALGPVLDAQGSDSAMFDNALELLVRAGRSLPHALAMLAPEAWESRTDLDPELEAFYRYHGGLMEPWDGPMLVAFSDGRVAGACLDRNGLRPARYTVTREGLVVLASEAGVVDLPAGEVVEHGRLGPGQMLVADTEAHALVDDARLKDELARLRPWREWLEGRLVRAAGLAPPGHDPRSAAPGRAPEPVIDGGRLLAAQRVHGYTREDVELLLRPMAEEGEEPIGAMGDDAALAVLSERPQPLFNYFKQLFAQVTNPPIDPLREALVMSLRTTLGAGGDVSTEGPVAFRQLELEGPVLRDAELERLRAVELEGLRAGTVDALFPARPGGLAEGLERLREAAARAVEAGIALLVLSDRAHDAERLPIPSLLAVAAVHHHLIDRGLRQRAGIVVESGEPREVMHVCLLVGYGAGAVNPYLAFATLRALAAEGRTRGEGAEARYVAALSKGVRKVMSKMGISTLASYRGAQIFEALGLARELVDVFFPGTASRIGGMGLEDIERDCLARRHDAYGRPPAVDDGLAWGGAYKWRRDGERHQLSPNVVGLLQHAVRSADYGVFKKYTRYVDERATPGCDLRGQLDLAAGDRVPLEEVEPARAIVRRFRTGGMSFGALSKEAHETLAVAMNRLGAHSNSGEGGEATAREVLDEGGDSRASAIRQIASGRFGVTLRYLLGAAELQIKIAQGAKPGEGGQLPGHKVDEAIARVRHATPGVGLISPPPHHDIYSIEDLAQLIHDLRRANPEARVSVKLVSEVGIGTVAAGVAKAGADHIVVSGHSGGTGASPLGSIKHTGLPWELGLAETQQVLVMNDLRGRVTLEVDGQLKSGRDVVVAALLGAEHFAFGTAALIASGCILMRACHLNTCPVGIATQDPVLRRRFAGLPEHVVNFMWFMAEEVREHLARLGFRRLEDAAGRVDRLRPRADRSGKAARLDLRALLHAPERPASVARCRREGQRPQAASELDRALIEGARPALERRVPVAIEASVRNVDRTAVTALASRIVRRYGERGLAPGTVRLRLRGAGGQSFGAFLAPGLEVRLEGIANDAFAKGLCGGRLILRPPAEARFRAEDQVIVGNVALYGATGGEAFIRGRAGERFAVRASGATAVVEGVGDHGCEYMTGGVVVVLGPTGRNFAAGMSGGVAYVLDEDGSFASRCNLRMVELERLEAEDQARLRELLATHRAITASPVAWRLLATWDRAAACFVKVMPKDLKRVLAARRLWDRTPRRAATG